MFRPKGARPSVRRSVGSFYYIPVRYWAFIVPVLMVGLAAVVLLDKEKPVAADAATPVDAAPTAPVVANAPPIVVPVTMPANNPMRPTGRR